jgi:AAA+ ATPase superfamily predicted ATPase
VKLPFLNRDNERTRLLRAIGGDDGSFCCLYGRRRCGKSRLLREILPEGRAVYYVGDRREGSLQRQALAQAMTGLIPGFDQVVYPDWSALLGRWWREAPRGAVLALDEFPYMVEASPELPSLLQKQLDAASGEPIHVVLCGSSQRMMQGLVLDESEPLYGRAREIIEVRPLGAAWLSKAFGTTDWAQMISVYAVWGGVPRYWEMAADFASLWQAIETLVLDPLGVLHREPERLLADDMRDTIQAASILAVVGRGCHRVTETAARLGKPATSLARPIQRLLQLGLLRRDVPFGQNPRSSKLALYAVEDPFLAFWFRFIDPNRSRLEAGAMAMVKESVVQEFPHHEGAIWERLVRAAIPHAKPGDVAWGPSARWWGSGTDRRPLEIDVVAESADGRTLLVGEVKRRVSGRELRMLADNLRRKVERLPFADLYAAIEPMLFAGQIDEPADAPLQVYTAEDILPSLT